eukprot:scaffold211438_cov28-Tisochrysis_lutea.AAC.2
MSRPHVYARMERRTTNECGRNKPSNVRAGPKSGVPLVSRSKFRMCCHHHSHTFRPRDNTHAKYATSKHTEHIALRVICKTTKRPRVAIPVPTNRVRA